METPVLKFVVLALAVFLVANARVAKVEGASVCGKSTPDDEAVKLAPCAMAASNAEVPVSDSCCLQVKNIGQNPPSLCAAMLSDTAKASGSKPEIAITIPKRCNLANRPVGYKFGPYTLA